MKELFLLKLGEIVLKGQNRRVFEDKLKTVTRRRMAKFGTFKVSIVQSTLYVEPLTDDCDLDGAWEACGTIFGVAQMCRCRACEKDLDAIFAAVCDYLGDELSMARSFKVESKRSDKRFPLNSIQISQEIGGRLAEEFPNVAVDVHTPDYTVNIEVRETAAYVHGPSVPGAGGLPTGTGGRAAVLLSGFTDNWQPLLEGVNIGGLGTPIASLASLIAMKQYMRAPHARPLRYLGSFLLYNLAALILLLLFSLLA